MHPPGSPPARGAAVRTALFVAILVAVVFGRIEPYRFIGDDGGITMRYAARFAAGEGFNYNDGEAINGCSNPLYTATLGGILALGASPEGAVRWLGLASLVGACALLTYGLLRRGGLSGLVGAAIAVLATLGYDSLYHYHFNGLESGFVILFAALLFVGLVEERRAWVGVALGLLVANKLDGALAAIAYTVAFLVARGRFPWKEAIVATCVAAPVFALLYFSFGSILPNSMTTKVAEHQSVKGFDPTWMHDLLQRGYPWIYWPAWATVVVSLVTRFRGLPFATVVFQVWFVASLTLYAVVDLGAPFPWYAAAPLACCLVLAPELVRRFLRLIESHAPQVISRPGVAVLGAAVVVAFASTQDREWRRRLAPQTLGMPLPDAGNLARQAAGAWLRRETDGTELLAVAYGLPAIEYPGPVYDLAGLNSARDKSKSRDAVYLLVGPLQASRPIEWSRGPRMLVGMFQYDASGQVYAVYAKPGSQVRKRRRRHLLLPLPGAAEVLPEGWQGNGCTVASGSEVRLAVRAPLRPTLAYSARGLGGPARLEVEVGGEVAADLALDPVRTSARVELGRAADEHEAPAGQPELWEVRFRVPGEADGGTKHDVRIDSVQLRVGRPVRPQDLLLSSPRRRARLLETARGGLPFRGVRP